MTREQALRIRAIIEKAVQSLATEDALAAPTLFPEWAAGVAYEKDTKVRRGDILYKVLTAHTSQADWTPEAAPSLFTKVLVSETGEVLEWEQPDSTNPYMKGDKVSYNGKTWQSTIDNNVWAPGVYGWEEV